MGAGSPMTAPGLDLTAFQAVAEAFINACNAFNNQNLATLTGMIDDNAVMYRIKSGNPIVGKQAILDYLNEKFGGDRPLCALITTELHPPSLPTSVRGTAYWESASDPTIGFRVKYEIIFDRDTYLITSFWARPG
jgi:hypothetical protein